MGLEWSAPNVPDEKGSSINQVSVVLWQSLTNCLAALQGKMQETADKLVRVYELHRRDVAKYPEQHQLKCPETQPQLSQLSQSTRRLCSRYHVQSPSSLQSFSHPVAVVCAVDAVSPNSRNFFSQLVVSAVVITSSRRRLCSRSHVQSPSSVQSKQSAPTLARFSLNSSSLQSFSRPIAVVFAVVLTSIRRRLCNRSRAQVSHQSVHRMTDVGQ